jgi:hypothetical protein
MVLDQLENNFKTLYDEYVRSGYSDLVGENIDENQQLKTLIILLDEVEVPLEKFIKENKFFLEKKRIEFNFNSIEDLIYVYRAKFVLMRGRNKRTIVDLKTIEFMDSLDD